MKLSDRLMDVAAQFAAASNVKEAARLRAKCTLEEWKMVLVEAKKIYAYHRATNYTRFAR
ncbi:MAG TPA: hypothetical protein VIY48_11375 [Candidatus Paceibacterota bacterium]